MVNNHKMWGVGILTALIVAGTLACGPATSANIGAVTQPPQSGDGGGSSGAVDACSVVTQADAEAFLGVDPGAGQSLPASGSSSACSFIGAASSGASLTVMVTPADSVDAATLALASMRQVSPDTAKDVAVGDAAFVNATLRQLVFRKGATLVVISATLPPDRDFESAIVTLAQAIAGRLP